MADLQRRFDGSWLAPMPRLHASRAPGRRWPRRGVDPDGARHNFDYTARLNPG